MSGSRSGFMTVLAGIVVAGLMSAPPAVGAGPAVMGPAPQAGSAVPLSENSVVLPMARKKPKPRVLFSSTQALVVDVDPDLPGAKSWKLKLQRKAKSKWKKVGIYRTQGAAETRQFPVPEGRYRVKVYARPGYRSVTTKAYRFTPATPPPPAPAPPPTPTPAPPPPTAPPPAPPDATAPGVVTGLAVEGRTATSISLAWTNPADPDLAEVIVRRAVGATAPATPADGAAVTLLTPTAAGVMDTGLAVATGYAYAVFTRDAVGNTSAGMALATTTLAPSVVSTTRVSVRTGGGQSAAWGSSISAINADGRWIAFESESTDLVDDDTNDAPDVFLHDRDSVTTLRVSVRSDGGQATGSGEPESTDPAISADGAWIVYSSLASNLVDSDTNDASDVFLYDRSTRMTRRISVRTDGTQAEGASYSPAISADGNWIAYVSVAANLVDDDTNAAADVFLHDRVNATTQRISVGPGGAQADTSDSSLSPEISADGRWVVYHSIATNLVDDDTNGVRDVFLYDRSTGTTQRVSVRSDGGQALVQGSEGPAISGDGRWITFESDAANLVDNDTNSMTDVFLHDRSTGTTQRVSVRSDGGQATGFSHGPAISGDGRWITYHSYAMNLIPNDTNDAADVFLFDRQTGTTQRVSVRTDGGQAGNISVEPAISQDGRWISYASSASDLVDDDTNGVGDVFLTRMW